MTEKEEYFEALDITMLDELIYCNISHSKIGGKDFRISFVELRNHHEPKKIFHELTAELVFVLEGKIEATVDSVTRTIEPLSLIYVPRMTVHSFSAKTSIAKMLVVHTPHVDFSMDHN